MIPHVEDCYFYKRIDSILIAVKATGEEIPVVKFKQKFIDLQIVDREPLEYIKKYMEMHPHLWETVKEEIKINQQLTLF
jgi:hypothetical protein